MGQIMKANEYVSYTTEAMWALPPGQYDVEFDDGVRRMTSRELILSHYFWRVHLEFPGTPMLLEHSVYADSWTSSTHFKIETSLLDSMHIDIDTSEIWSLAKVFYEINNAIFNMEGTRLTEYVTTGSLYDICSVLRNRRIKTAKDSYHAAIAAEEPTETMEAEIQKVHTVVEDVLYKDKDELSGNNIKLLTSVDIFSKGQVLQLLGIRGYLHDIDNGVFSQPIHTGYAEGMNTVYDQAIESRSGTRAQMNNKGPLEDSEYYNRKMQMCGSITTRAADHPCVGFETIKTYVDTGDLTLLKGKYHMLNGQPVMIWNTVEHLVGKTIDLRTITGCGSSNVQHVCPICTGWSYKIVPPVTNIGHAFISALCAIISQLILSTKHYEASKAAMRLLLEQNSVKWLKIFASNSNTIFLTLQAARRNPILRFSTDGLSRLGNILNIDIEDLSVGTITSCKMMNIRASKEGVGMGLDDDIKLEIVGSGCSFSGELLEYLKINGWVNHGKYIEFTLTDWDYKKPLLLVPYKGDNVTLFFKEVSGFVMPAEKSISKITNYRTRSAAVSELTRIIRQRVNVNIVLIEMFVRACMVVSDNDVNLPHSTGPFKFTSLANVLKARSLSPMLIFEGQYNQLLNPSWYEDKPRHEHMLDQLWPIINRDLLG